MLADAGRQRTLLSCPVPCQWPESPTPTMGLRDDAACQGWDMPYYHAPKGRSPAESYYRAWRPGCCSAHIYFRMSCFPNLFRIQYLQLLFKSDTLLNATPWEGGTGLTPQPPQVQHLIPSSSQNCQFLKDKSVGCSHL